MAGETFASGQYRWAPGGEDLLMQIRSLNNKSQKPVPFELQALYFKTVVCIPLQHGAGVLEIGTNELVPENDGMLSQILKLINGLACQGISRGRQIMTSSPFEAGTKVLQNDAGIPYCDSDEQYRSASMKETYGSRVLLQHTSTSSSLHLSASSTTSSSTPSANDQRGDSSNTNVLLPTTNYEDKLMSPANPLQATATSIYVVNSLDELHVLKHMDQIDMRDFDSHILLQELDNYRLNYPHIVAPPQDHHLHINDFPTLFSPADFVASSALPSLVDSHQHACPHSEGNSDINYLFDHMLQPMQCAYVGNEQANAHHSLNEVVRGSFKEHSMECQSSAYNQSQVSSVQCLPSVTSQFASHSALYTNNQQQQWGPMFSGAKEQKGITDLFRQSDRHTHAMGASDYSLTDNSQEANLGHESMLKQNAASAMVDEGSTSKNRRLTTRVSSTNLEGHKPIKNDKMASDKGKKRDVSSTPPFTNQAVGSYFSHASGSAEPDKVVGPSPSQGSFVSYDLDVPEDYKLVGSSVLHQSAGSYASYSSDSSAEVCRVVDSRTSHSAGGYVSYVPGSAEAEKLDGTSAMISSQEGAGSFLGSNEDRNRVQHGERGEFLDLQQLQRVQGDHHNASKFANMGFLQESKVLNFAKSASPEQNEAAVHHMYAERDRRRKQGHCIDTLRTLVPTITKKYPKVAILESTVQHIKELKDRICELERKNAALRIKKLEDQQRESTKESSNFVSNQKHATNVKSSTNIGVQENAVCRYIDSSSADGRSPHFHLGLIMEAQDVTANATIIEILESLQAKNLCCYEIDSEFFKDTNKLSINILANYKNGGYYSISLGEIQSIKEWWTNLSKD